MWSECGLCGVCGVCVNCMWIVHGFCGVSVEFSRVFKGDHFRQVTILGRWLFIQVPLYYTGDHPREVAVHTGPTVLYR